MKLLNFKNVLFLYFFGVSMMLNGQQKTGNIVEYFGKEKIDDINEGKLVHVFKKGLALKIENFNFNSGTFPVDPVFDRFLMRTDYTIQRGEVFDIDFSGNELKWKTITTDTTNSFSNSDLRSSYVFLTYNSNTEKKVLFEASGHTIALINGFPHEGDYYDYGWNLIPVKLKKGVNVFVLKVGRFPRIRARLIEPHTEVLLTSRDITLPDILLEENKAYSGAIRIINSSEQWLTNYTLEAEFFGEKSATKLQDIPPMSVQKVPFVIPATTNLSEEKETVVQLQLQNKSAENIAAKSLSLAIKSKFKHHKKTFISAIDGSVQYYSVAPSLEKDVENQALFLSVHGASVEAVNQANAYKQKDWGTLVAPTNRRAFGFAWEDWGRLDALEVLADAKKIYRPDERKIYLTGHSMGGHGTWYLGATYPDYFAAIAPCAGYPDLLLYRDSFIKNRLQMPQEQLTQFGMTPKVVERIKLQMDLDLTPIMKMVDRAGTPSRTLELIRNYLHFGVYVLHGEKDQVVPTEIARDMRTRLGTFHNDFTYYEYPDGEHWYGDHSVDWLPLFDFLQQRTKKPIEVIKNLEFYTGSPGVSATSNHITIYQQKNAFEISSFTLNKENGIKIETNNVAILEVDTAKLSDSINSITLNGKALRVKNQNKVFLKETNGEWNIISHPALQEKGPHRNGSFKDAFRNNVVFVYATQGSAQENEWYFNKARFDAETFWYRANGYIELVKDSDFSLKKYADRNVILYGNQDNNAAWKILLKESPVQVKNNEITFGNKKLPGAQWGMYFIIPRSDSNTASIGVITATGTAGMKSAYANHYLVNGTTFPDVLIFDETVLSKGLSAVKCAGFFGNDWSIENGSFEWQ